MTAALGTVVNNTAAISCVGASATSNTVSFVVGQNAPSLTLTKSVAPSSAAPGGAVTYTLAYGNSGNIAASNVIITDALPANLTYVPNSATGSPMVNGSTLTWSPGALAVSGSGQVTFQATVAAGTASGSTINNTASISCTEVPTAVQSNTATVTVTAAPVSPNLTLSKSVSPASAAPGGTVTYTLAYGNTGGAATNVVLTDALPATRYVANSATGNPTINGSTLTWALGALAAGGSGQVTFQATVAANAANGSTIHNSASITCTQVTTPVTSNTATVTVSGGNGDRGDWWMFHPTRNIPGGVRSSVPRRRCCNGYLPRATLLPAPR